MGMYSRSMASLAYLTACCLRQRLIDVWAGVEQSVIDCAIAQWRRHLHVCIRAKGGHFEYAPRHKLVKKSLN